MKEVNNEALIAENKTNQIIYVNDDNALMSDDISQWATAFAKAQPFIGNVVKDKKANTGKFSYTYAELGAVLENAKKPLSDNGLCLTQLLKPTRDGKLTLITYLIHESGQWVRSFFPIEPVVMVSKEGKEIGNPLQQLGSAIAYGRRYSAVAALGIAQEDDDAQSLTKEKPQELIIKSSKQLQGLCEEAEVDTIQFVKFHGISREKPETVINGVNNFESLKQQYMDHAATNTNIQGTTAA